MSVVADMVEGRLNVGPLTNQSGAQRSEGEVVVIDTANDNSFTTTTTEGDTGVVGIVAETIAAAAAGRVVLGGWVSSIEVDGTTNRGDFLKTSTTAGKATPVSQVDEGVFARAMSACVGAGQVSGVLFGPSGPPVATAYVYFSVRGITPSATNGCGDPTKRTLATNGVNFWVAPFDQTTQEYGEWDIVLPNWDGGTITFIAHWTCQGATSGTSIWGLQATAVPDDGAMDVAWGTAQEVTDTFLANDDLHISPESAAITVSGSPAAGNRVQLRIYQDAATATIDADSDLLGITIKYTKA